MVGTDGARQLTHGEIMGALTGILIAVLLSALDQTIVNPALTAIATDLHEVNNLSWIIVGYFVTSTALMPVYGKLSDIYGRGRLISIAITIFVAASLLCACAQSLVQLALFRALEGVGGGGLTVISQAMIADFISPRDRGKYQGFIAGTWAFAGVLGPPLGGLLTDQLSWRFIFWINLPLGLLAFVLCRRVAKRMTNPPARSSRLDYAGALLLIAGVSLVLLAVSGSTSGWDAQAISEMGAGLVLLALFVAQEFRADDPIVPPRLYRNAIVVGMNVVGLLLSMVQFGALVLLPVYFQLVMGVPATISGFMIVPMLLLIPVASVLAGQFMARTGRYKAIFPVAFVLMTVAMIAFARMSASSSTLSVELAVGLLGLGIGCCGPVLMAGTQNAAHGADLGAATSSITFARSLGASLGTAMFWAILLVPLASASLGSTDALFHAGYAGIVGLPAGERERVMGLLAMGFHNVFVISAGIAFGTALFSLFLREEPLKTAPRSRLVKSMQ
jgi:EmrB/QacA subfamily drug resistance transporter